MKKSSLKLMVLLGLCISGILFSCNNEKNLSEPVKGNLQKFEDYKIFGKAHNELLSHANDHFIVTRSNNNMSLEDGLQYLANFQKEHVNEMSIDDEAKALLKAGLDEYKDFYAQDQLYNMSLLSTRSSSEGLLKDKIGQIYEAGVIDHFEHDGLLTLCDASLANYNGELSVAEFKAIIADLITKWEAQHYTEESKYGRTLAIALSVSESSMDWWSENTVETRALPLWVGADVIGAVLGAASSVVNQLVLSDIEFSWTSLGWQTVSGAAIGSTGVVTKVGKWISNLF